MPRGGKTGTAGDGLRFECSGCGDCCKVRGAYSRLYVYERDVEPLAEELGLSKPAFLRRYCFTDEYGWTQLTMPGDCCAFLDEVTNACAVYSARPTQCRTFPFWPEFVDGVGASRRWSLAVRRICEGTGSGPAHSTAYAERLIKELEDAEKE